LPTVFKTSTIKVVLLRLNHMFALAAAIKVVSYETTMHIVALGFTDVLPKYFSIPVLLLLHEALASH